MQLRKHTSSQQSSARRPLNNNTAATVVPLASIHSEPKQYSLAALAEVTSRQICRC